MQLQRTNGVCVMQVQSLQTALHVIDNHIKFKASPLAIVCQKPHQTHKLK